MANRAELLAVEATIERRAVNIFVVRRWQDAGAETHFELAHVLSGRRTVAADDAVAAAWIGGFARGAQAIPARSIVACGVE